MVAINNTLTVGELRDMLANYHDSTPVLFVADVKNPSGTATPINHSLEVGWTSEGSGRFSVVLPTDKECIGTFIGLIK